MFSGENLIMEDLPVGTRVIYPNRPMTPVANPKATIRYALNHPEDSEPLHALLAPGMKVTIAVDDISMPLPIMRTPDVRQLVLEIVCEMLADHGVDDVHIVIALGLHRRMHDWEIKRMVGQKVWDEYWPDRLYNHDGCDPDGMVLLGKTPHGELVEMNRRVAESDLTIYVNLNFVPMNGGNKSMAVGLCGYESLKAHHNPKAIVDSSSYMDPPKSFLSHSFARQGALVEKTLKVFHIETVLNNRAFDGPLSFLTKNEDDFTETDRLKYQAMKWTLDKLPFAARREIFMRTPAAYELIACYAGACDPVHARTLQKQNEQNCVEVQGQADILLMGIPYISPYNVNSKALNPLLVQVMALGYFYHMYRNQPLLRDGGVLILTHPCSDRVRSGPSPELHRVLQSRPDRDDRRLHDRDEVPGRARVQPELRRDVPARQRVSRRAPVLHVVLGPARSREDQPRDRGRRRQRDGAVDHGLGDGRLDRRGDRDGARHDGPQRADHDDASPAVHDLRCDVATDVERATATARSRATSRRRKPRGDFARRTSRGPTRSPRRCPRCASR